MATRLDIQEAFYANLVTAVSGVVSQDSIVLQDPEKAASVPAVVYNEFATPRSFNEYGGPEKQYTYDNSGDVTDTEYVRYIESQYDVRVLSDDASQVQELYEDIRRRFQSFTEFRDETDLDTDVLDVSVEGSETSDITDRDLYGDTTTITVLYETRNSKYDSLGGSPTPISAVDIDVDSNGSVVSYTVQ